MSFGVPAALWLYLAAGFGVDGQASLELRGGRAPIIANQAPEWGVMGVVTPDVQLWYLSHRLELRLDYGLRAFWREPNDSLVLTDPTMPQQVTARSRLDPLLLHQVGLVVAARASRRVRMTAQAAVSYGEADYTTTTAILGPTQPTVPVIPKFLNVSASSGTQIDLSRLSKLGLTLLFTHRRPIDSAQPQSTDPNAFAFPSQTSIVATPGLSVTLNRQGALTLGTVMSYGTFSGDPTIPGGTTVLLIAPQVGWRAFLSTRSNLHVGAGVNYIRLSPKNEDLFPFSPVGDVTFESTIPKREGLETQVLGGARLEYFYDPVSGRAGPRLLVSASAYSAMSTDWLVGGDAGYSTVFIPAFDPADPRAALTPPDETAVYASIPIRHRTSNHLLTTFGFRWEDRGPHSLSGFHQQQLWLYLVLTATTRAPAVRKVQ